MQSCTQIKEEDKANKNKFKLAFDTLSVHLGTFYGMITNCMKVCTISFSLCDAFANIASLFIELFFNFSN